MAKAHTHGSGWHKESLRHREAKLKGHRHKKYTYLGMRVPVEKIDREKHKARKGGIKYQKKIGNWMTRND